MFAGVMSVSDDRPGTFGSKGCIELIIGPMFSEKSTEMVSRIRRAAYAGQASVIIKHNNDERYGGAVDVLTTPNIRQTSTPSSEFCAAIRVVAAVALSDVVPNMFERVIGVDEGQFYPDLVKTCERWASMGFRVIVAALDGDFARRPFGGVCDLVPLCESVKKRRGICMDCRCCESAFTRRLGSNRVLIQIGAGERYRAVCRACYNKSAHDD